MARGRPRKPTPLHILDGTFRHDRHDTNTPCPTAALPECPKGLNAAARKKWREVVKAMDGTGVLTLADSDMLAIYCTTYARWEAAERSVAEQGEVVEGRINPYRKIADQAIDQLRHCGALLGLNPSDRSRLDIKPAAGKATGVPSRDRSKGPPPPPKANNA